MRSPLKSQGRLKQRTPGRWGLLRDVMKLNMKNFRVFGPDENTSNKLNDIYEVSKEILDR